MSGILGGASSTDRKNVLSGYGDLGNIYNTGITSGSAASGAAQGYDQSILGGNRSSIMQSMAPEINSITGQANQNRKQQASMGTARGGGTNALNQQQQQNVEGQISNTINQARPQAAAQLAGIGSNMLGLGENAAGNLESAASNNYKTTSAQNAETGQALGSIASGLIFGL